MELEFNIHGGAELSARLTDLSVKVEKNILRGMVRAASKPVADDARARAPRLQEFDPRRFSGALAMSVRIMSTLARGGLVKGGVVAGGRGKVKEEYGRFTADAFYARFVEYGTAKMPAKPFMRPAGDGKTGAAIAAAAAYVRERLDAGDLK